MVDVSFHRRRSTNRRTPPMRLPLLNLLLCAIIVGCSRSQDLGKFMVTEVSKHGGGTRANSTLPQLRAQLTVKRDRNGFQASVTDVPFASVDSLMQQMFGKPAISSDATQTASGQPHRVWGAAQVGVAIQLIGRTNGADIICVRAMRDTSEVIREMDRPWWKVW
jgi:hypothetical protein